MNELERKKKRVGWVTTFCNTLANWKCSSDFEFCLLKSVWVYDGYREIYIYIYISPHLAPATEFQIIAIGMWKTLCSLKPFATKLFVHTMQQFQPQQYKKWRRAGYALYERGLYIVSISRSDVNSVKGKMKTMTPNSYLSRERKE